MIRKHTRRAAKAAFAISLGVAIVLGGTAAVASAKPQAKPTVIVGNKNFTEEFILGQLYGQALAAKGFPVKYAGSLGSSELADTAIKSGKINLLPEYTGVVVLDIAKEKSPKSEAATYAAAKKFEETRGLTLLNPTPFYDSDTFTVLTSTAKKYGLKTIGDMKKVKSFS
jgi:osmoprotectant transport system substrate-binding protein